jgi:hypothetical protein
MTQLQARFYLLSHHQFDSAIKARSSEALSRLCFNETPVIFKQFHGTFARRRVCDHQTGEASSAIRYLKRDCVRFLCTDISGSTKDSSSHKVPLF